MTFMFKTFPVMRYGLEGDLKMSSVSLFGIIVSFIFVGAIYVIGLTEIISILIAIKMKPNRS